MKFLRRALDKENISYTDNTMEKFEEYRQLVLDWNEKVNLTAIKDPDEFEIKHFVDSVAGATFYACPEFTRLIDVGTGAGFPGMPLAILFPEKQFILLDSLAKRIRIIEEMASRLGLTNVRAIHGRAEDLARSPAHREAYDICFSRAVAKLGTLAELCLPFVRVGGYFVAYKSLGPAMEKELADAARALQILGGELQTSERFEIATGEAAETIRHQLLYFKKTQKTPHAYPRKAGTPEKKPL